MDRVLALKAQAKTSFRRTDSNITVFHSQRLPGFCLYKTSDLACRLIWAAENDPIPGVDLNHLVRWLKGTAVSFFMAPKTMQVPLPIAYMFRNIADAAGKSCPDIPKSAEHRFDMYETALWDRSFEISKMDAGEFAFLMLIERDWIAAGERVAE